MKIRSQLEYDIDAHLIREDESVFIVVHGINIIHGSTDELPPFFKLRDLDELDLGGFDGVETGIVIDCLDAGSCEDRTAAEVLDAYFNSPYGVA